MENIVAALRKEFSELKKKSYFSSNLQSEQPNTTTSKSVKEVTKTPISPTTQKTATAA
jgi:hypothetical protein